jgi:hypothetical protein
MRPGKLDCTTLRRGSLAVRSGGQSREQLGLHGDNENRMELEILVRIIDTRCAWTRAGTSSGKEVAPELDGLHARIFPVVCCTQSVEPISSTETCWKEELRHRKSEANRNRNAKPRLK